MDLGRTLDCISDDPDYSKRYPDVKPSPSETSLKDFDEPDDRSLDDGKSFDDLRSYEEFRYDHVLGSSLPSIGTFKEGHVRPKSKSLVPPVAMALPKTLLEKDGVVVTDDYYWLRDRDNPKVLKYLEDENAYADIYMKNSKELMDSLYNEFCMRVGGDERSCYTQEDDFYYYTRINDEQQYQVHCRKFESLDNEEVIILDENKEAEGEDYYAMGPFEVSPDHCMLACGVDTAGDEKFTLLVKDLTTGKWLPEEIYPVGWTVRWAADNKTLFYTRVNEFGRSFQLYRHIIGENAPDGTDDELIYEEPDDRYILRITTTNNKKFFLMRVDGQITNEVWYLSTSQPRAQFQLFAPRTRGVMYFLASHGSWFYIQTNEGGSYNYKVVRSPAEDPSNRDLWEEVLPHREDVLIEQINLFRHHFVVWEWEGGLQKIRVQDLSDGEVHYVQLPEQLYSVWPGERRDEDDTLGVQYFNSNILRFSYTNFTQPIVVYDYDMDNWRKKKIKEVRVSGYIREHYHQKRIFAQASDGFMIPISLVYKISLKNSAGGNPVLLYGYGAYGGQILPEFNSERISLLDRGFIFAIAHVRGDATMGWKSYEQGKWFHKMNTFTDFIACAEHLINEGYTTVEKLAIHGRSAGGLLISAVVNLRPDLFQVAVLDVPFVDVIGSMMDRTIPWTPFEWEEWGNPNETDFFHYMLGYSPYHNLTAKEYPNLLITGGLNDPRVSYCEPAKYTAKLRKVKANNNALLLKTYLAGHMGSSGRFDHMEETAFTYAFILRHLTVEMPSTVPPNLMQVISPVAVTPPDLLAMFQGYQVTMLLCSALDLGVFNQLHRHADFKTDIATLAKALNVKKRGLKLLLNSLVAVGLLNQEEDQYQLSNIAVTHLVEGLPGYIGDLRFTLATDHQWTALRQLPQAIIQGHAVGAPQKQPLARVAQSNGKHAAATLVEVLAPWATRRKFISVLDIKCGNGILGFSLAKKRTNVRVWGLDTNDQLDITKEIAKEMDLNDRVSFIEKDIPCTDESFGGPYDLIIVGLNVLNGLGTVDAPVLIQQISDSLKSNGRVVFYEMISDVDPSPHAHLSSLSMFVTRRKGKIHSLGWFKDMLEDGGFVPPTVHNLQPFSEKLLVSYRNIISRKEKVKKPQ